MDTTLDNNNNDLTNVATDICKHNRPKPQNPKTPKPLVKIRHIVMKIINC